MCLKYFPGPWKKNKLRTITNMPHFKENIYTGSNREKYPIATSAFKTMITYKLP